MIGRVFLTMSDAFWMALFGFLATALNIIISRRNNATSQENKEAIKDMSQKVNGNLEAAVNKAKDEARRTNPPRVLIVDDSTDDMDLAEIQLKKFRVDIFRATSAVEAERLLMENIGPGRGYPFDFVLVDLKMPGDDVGDVFRTFTLRAPKVPLIILTGHPSLVSTADFSGIPRIHIQKPLLAHHVKSLLEQFNVPYRMASDIQPANDAPNQI